MFAKVLAPLASFVFLAAAAAPGGGLLRRVPTQTVTTTSQNPVPTTISQCNTGGAQCCNIVDNASNIDAGILATALSLADIVLGDIDPVVGLVCSPILVILGVPICTQQPVCCENNSFNGVINVGCSPIAL